MHKSLSDLRAKRTHSALLRAFTDLIQTQRYENLTVADIAIKARVSRSTFYTHFPSKDALFARSIAGPFSVLADTVAAEMDERKLVQLLDHFWDNRVLARAVLLGPVRRRTVEVLIGEIRDRLKSAGIKHRGALILPIRLASIQLAEGLLAPITAWLLGESKCTSNRLAVALRRVSRAAVGAMASAKALHDGRSRS